MATYNTKIILWLNGLRQIGFIQHIPHINFNDPADLSNRYIIGTSFKWVY